MSDEKKIYLGDGVYATFDGWNIWLRVNSIDASEAVCLEPEVIAALFLFLKSLGWKEPQP